MSDFSSFCEKAWAYITGKGSAADAAGAGQKLLTDVASYEAGLAAAGPYAPSIVADTAALVAEGAALVASKGLTLPGFLSAGSDLQKLAADLAAAETAFMAGKNSYKVGAGLAAHAPEPAGS